MPDLDYTFQTPQGDFVLQRVPQRQRELLRAFDAADEYLLNHLASQTLIKPRLLVVNDSFGALAVALHDYQPVAWSDSFLSQHATRLNLQANNIAESSVSLLNSLAELNGVFTHVLLKVPKTLALLEDQLIKLRPHLQADSEIILAGMIKNLPPTVWKLAERILGTTRTSLAEKKARLIFVDFDETLNTPHNPYPSHYRLEHTDYQLINHANVFSRDSLDIGTRFFLAHLPIKPEAKVIIDLACGNGVIGLLAAEKNPQAQLHFVDESFMAVASAQENFNRAFGHTRMAEFQAADGLTGFANGSADLILCNPPFHQQQTIGDYLAKQFFRDAKRVLNRGGELWLVANRHLPYYAELKRLFGHCQTVASNSKFVILRTAL